MHALKVYEYLATGKPVVSTPLEGLNACREVVALAGDAEAFGAAVEAALGDPDAGRAARLAVRGRTPGIAGPICSSMHWTRRSMLPANACASCGRERLPDGVRVRCSCCSMRRMTPSGS